MFSEIPWFQVISAGYCILMLLTIPFGLLNIGDNISVQMIAFFALLVISVVWSVRAES